MWEGREREEEEEEEGEGMLEEGAEEPREWAAGAVIEDRPLPREEALCAWRSTNEREVNEARLP